MSAFATFRSFVGIAKETTPGTAVAPTDYVPIASDPKSSDKINLIDDKSWRGSAVESYGKIAGSKSGTVELAGNLDLTSIGYMLQSVLPDLTESGAGPYIHTFSCYNATDGQPKSYTIHDFDGDVQRAFAGAKSSELDVKFDATGLVTYSSKWSTFGSVSATTATPSYSTQAPIAAYTGVVKFAGATVSNVMSGSLTFKRKTEYLTTIEGTQQPYQIFSGALGVTGKFTAVLLASDPMLAAYIANTTQVIDVKFTSGASSLEFTTTAAILTKADVARGKDYVEVNVEFEAVGNTTDDGTSGGYSPAKVILTNTTAASVYK